MFRFVFLIFILSACASSKSTIDDVQKLFDNTIKRWGVEIKDKRDYHERFNRLVKTKESVDMTASEVLLESLNRFSVNNDEEQAALEGMTRLQSNSTMQLLMDQELSAENTPHRMGKEAPGKLGDLPDFFTYWERELGLPPVEDQMACGSCWVFPAKTALEALYKQLKGVEKVFSAQYFVDCSFTYSGCGGAKVNKVFELTKDRQYLMSESDFPYTADYEPCGYTDWINSRKNNALEDVRIQNWYPVGNNEDSFLRAVQTSPVAFGSQISINYYSYSGGIYSDSLCAVEPYNHAQLLVGYTKTFMRVRGSYGKDFGEEGYINYKRNDPNNLSCRFFQHGYTVSITEHPGVQYEFCANTKMVTRKECRASCLAMNKDGESGWDLAVIPTVQDNDQVVNMANARWPGFKKFNKMFNYFWIGLSKPANTDSFQWNKNEGPFSVNYFNYSRYYTGEGKYGLIDKNSGVWVLKNNLKLKARGVCSRVTT